MAAAVIPKTWALIDARFLRVIAELVLDYFFLNTAPFGHWSASGSWEYCTEVCHMDDRPKLIAAALTQLHDEMRTLKRRVVDVVAKPPKTDSPSETGGRTWRCANCNE